MFYFILQILVYSQKKKGTRRYICKPDLCKITEDLVFTDPFGHYDTNDYEPELQLTIDELWSDKTLKLKVAQYKYKF